jgi:hypothetical protein
MLRIQRFFRKILNMAAEPDPHTLITTNYNWALPSGLAPFAVSSELLTNSPAGTIIAESFENWIIQRFNFIMYSYFGFKYNYVQYSLIIRTLDQRLNHDICKAVDGSRFLRPSSSAPITSESSVFSSPMTPLTGKILL